MDTLPNETATAKHTPGPWRTLLIQDDTHGGIRRWNVEKSKYPPMILFDMISGQDEGEREANARLVAAAPELLAACKHVMRDANASLAMTPESYKLILTAIMHAEGRQP